MKPSVLGTPALLVMFLVALFGPLLRPDAALATSDLVISQVYGGGGGVGAVFRNDFIEVFNRGNTTVSLTAKSVQWTQAGGVIWQVTPLSGNLAPGQYYLVQEAAAGGGTTDLPTPDAIGTITMGQVSGRVALVNSTAALTPGDACPSGPALLDLVGYGTATCFEGSAATPTLSATNAAIRNSNGCADTDVNSADFSVAAANPRNTASPLNTCGGGGGSPTNPSGVGAANPSTVVSGNAVYLTVAVTPGTLPTSTGLSVVADLSAIGGSLFQTFWDDGTNGDGTAADLIFTFLTTVAVGTTAGAKTLPAVITDAQGRPGACNIQLTVIDGATPARKHSWGQLKGIYR